MSLPTASSLGRVIACPPSWVLDGSDRDSEAAQNGTFIHKVLELHVSDPSVVEAFLATTDDVELRAFCASLEVEFYA